MPSLCEQISNTFQNDQILNPWLSRGVNDHLYWVCPQQLLSLHNFSCLLRLDFRSLVSNINHPDDSFHNGEWNISPEDVQ